LETPSARAISPFLARVAEVIRPVTSSGTKKFPSIYASKIVCLTDILPTDPNILSVQSVQNLTVLSLVNNDAGDSQAAELREDAQLLRRIADGDQQALASLYRRRGSLLYSLVVRMLVSEMEAQEVMQDAFVLIWRRAPQYDVDRSSPVAWMIMITRGLALDRLRARSRRTAGQAAYEREVASLEIEVKGERQAERDELATACAAALHRLPEPQARSLQLAFLRGWTHEEIASATGEPLGTIKARIRRGLLALRKAMKDYHG
jgi:RNA polymerase sigma-70 factor, ECF subfamily